MIPESNVANLMLKEEIVEAIREGKFHIYPISTIDQGKEVLTGVKAGARTSKGDFERGTVNAMVNARLGEMARKLSEFSEVAPEKKKKK